MPRKKDNTPARRKVLNLFAGIGGNRELWQDCDITAVEYDPAIAEVYAKRFPEDTVVVGDALAHVVENYANFDFIWASPPCPTHGQFRHNLGVLGKGALPVMPDMTSLYGLIVFLQTYFKGKWVVENVIPYYEPLVKPSFVLGRHLFWSNFYVRGIHIPHSQVMNRQGRTTLCHRDGHELVEGTAIENKLQVLNNRVDAKAGAHILEYAYRTPPGRRNTFLPQP